MDPEVHQQLEACRQEEAAIEAELAAAVLHLKQVQASGSLMLCLAPWLMRLKLTWPVQSHTCQCVREKT